MTRNIGGALDMTALARMAFNVLPRELQVQAIARLSASGMSLHGISQATGLSIEQIQTILEGPWAFP